MLILCAIFTLPLLAVLGHDVWHLYNDKHVFFAQPFPFGDAGWLWTHYARGSYDWARGAIDPAFWKQYIGPVLETKAAIVAATPAAVVYGITLFLKLFGIGPFAGTGLLLRRAPGMGRRAPGGKYSFDDGGPSKKAKYKRR